MTHISPTSFLATGVSGLIDIADGSTNFAPQTSVGLGVVNGNRQFFAAIEALAQNNVARILAHPKLVTVSGRPAAASTTWSIRRP